MGNAHAECATFAIDKTFRSLSPVTWVDAALDNKQSYYCPECGREVWAYGSMVGTKCLGCPGRRSKSQQITEYKQQISTLKTTIADKNSTISTYETAHTNMEDKQKQQWTSAEKKKDEFLPKVTKINNEYSSNSDQKDDTSFDINADKVQEDQNNLDELSQTLKSAKAGAETFANLNKDLAQEVTGVPTYGDQQQFDEAIRKCNDAQQQISQKRKNATEQKDRILVKEKKLSNDKIKVEQEKNKNRDIESKLNNDLIKTDELRKELNQVSGAEMNANPEAFKEMQQKFNELCKLLKTKHADNKKKMAELEDWEEKIHDMQKKLEKQKLKNKYIIQLLDVEYERISQAKDDIRTKFEERGTYFLAITCGLKQDIIEKLEELVGEEHDMDMIKEINADDLIDAGIEKRLLRVKILKAIAALPK